MKVYADIHLFSPAAIQCGFDPSKTYDENTLFVGDIFDLANSKKSELEANRRIAYDFIARHPKTFIPGNHERITDEDKYILKNGCIYVHGDMQIDPIKWGEYRRKPQGASFFKRHMIVPLIEEAEKIVNRKPKDVFLINAHSLAVAHGVKKVCTGHFHPQEMIVLDYEGVNMTICKRGLNFTN